MKETARPDLPRTAAASNARLRKRATVSGSRRSMPNLARSGVNVTRVQLSDGAQGVMVGGCVTPMLFSKVCEYALRRAPSAVSTTNLVEKMLASLAPYPLRPPVT